VVCHLFCYSAQADELPFLYNLVLYINSNCTMESPLESGFQRDPRRRIREIVVGVWAQLSPDSEIRSAKGYSGETELETGNNGSMQ